MLKGENYASQLYENWSNRLAFNTLLGGNSGVVEDFANELEVTVSGSNVTIDTGVAVIKGGILRNTSAATLSVQLEANKYCIVVLEIDLSQTNTEETFNQGSFKIISQANSYPTLTQQDIVNQTDSGIYQFELARFQTSSSEILNLTDTRQMLSYEALMSEITAAIQALIQGGLTAADVGYVNTNSGLVATNVQAAIDELSGYLAQLNDI